MLLPRKYFHFSILATALILLSGCAGHEVRHLASDACLVVPGQTDMQQVVGLMGPPNDKVTLENGAEQWIYYQSQKSLLRKTPYIGGNLGEEKFDVLYVTFENGKVGECVYRHFGEEEFDKLGISTGEVSE